MRKILFSFLSVHPSPGVGRLEKSPSPHLFLSHKRFQFKIKVQKIGQRGREGFRGSESDRKGEKDQHFYLKGTVQKYWIDLRVRPFDF
jgi:hypothetical protein